VPIIMPINIQLFYHPCINPIFTFSSVKNRTDDHFRLIFMLQNFHVSFDTLEEACRTWGVEKVMLFGSALRDDFSDTSDIDLLLEFKPDIVHSLFSYDRMHNDFRRAFDREVDIVNLQGLLSSRNEHRKHNILSSAKDFYVLQS
jgi:predicted nucleotidyltransferase